MHRPREVAASPATLSGQRGGLPPRSPASVEAGTALSQCLLAPSLVVGVLLAGRRKRRQRQRSHVWRRPHARIYRTGPFPVAVFYRKLLGQAALGKSTNCSPLFRQFHSALALLSHSPMLCVVQTLYPAIASAFHQCNFFSSSFLPHPHEISRCKNM
jgi:hypothetical protein